MREAKAYLTWTSLFFFFFNSDVALLTFSQLSVVLCFDKTHLSLRFTHFEVKLANISESLSLLSLSDFRPASHGLNPAQKTKMWFLVHSMWASDKHSWTSAPCWKWKSKRVLTLCVSSYLSPDQLYLLNLMRKVHTGFAFSRIIWKKDDATNY